MAFDVGNFRKSFPQLERTVGPNPLVYFDSGASTLKHSGVTDRLNSYNRFEVANVHRGAHQTSQQGTVNYEGARSQIAKFLKAESSDSIIFTRGTTEGINFVASGMAKTLKAGDEILISPFEHHSNIVPWQEVCALTGASLKVVPFDSRKGVTLEAFKSSLTSKTKVFATILHSNSFGNRLPVEPMISLAKNNGTLTLVDGAQSVLTEPLDLTKLQCDFFCFSGHKVYGPYGIGVLYIAPQHLESFPPYQTGGSMIDRVDFDKTTYAKAPQKFEAGTPNISGAIGLGEAVRLIESLDFQAQHHHVLALRQQLFDGLSQMPFIDLYEFESSDYAGCLSFNFKGTHPSDVGTLFDKYGFAVRAGHHCTQPLMSLLGISGTVRASLSAYNNEEEIQRFLEVTKKMQEFF